MHISTEFKAYIQTSNMTDSKESTAAMLYEELFDYACHSETTANTTGQTAESMDMDMEESADVKANSAMDTKSHHSDDEKACDDLDLYDDIIVEDDMHEKETYKEMLQKFGEAMATISKLESENTTLLSSVKQLKTTSESAKKNISSILLTARAEVKRKDMEINRLRKQLNGKSPFLRNRCKRYGDLNTSSIMAESDSSYVRESGHSSDDRGIPRNRPSHHSQSENSDSDKRDRNEKDTSSHSKSYKDRIERDKKSRRRYEPERREVIKSRHSKYSRGGIEQDSERKFERHRDSDHDRVSDKSVHSDKEHVESDKRRKSSRWDGSRGEKGHVESDRERKSNRLESSRDETGKLVEKEDAYTLRNSHKKDDKEKPTEKHHSKKHETNKDSVSEKSYSSPSGSSKKKSRSKSKDRKQEKSSSRETESDRTSQNSSRSSTRLFEKRKKKQCDKAKHEAKERNCERGETSDLKRVDEKCENVGKGVFDLRQKLRSKQMKGDVQNLKEKVEKSRAEEETSEVNVEKAQEQLIEKMLDVQNLKGDHKADSKVQDTVTENTKKSTFEKHRKLHKDTCVDLESDRLFLSQLLNTTQEKKKVTSQMSDEVAKVEQRGQTIGLLNDKTKEKKELRRDVIDYCDIENEVDSNTETVDMFIPDDYQKSDIIKNKIKLKDKVGTVSSKIVIENCDKASVSANSDKHICESQSQDNQQTYDKEIQLNNKQSESRKQTISESSDTSLLYANIGNNNEITDEITSFDDDFDSEIFSLGQDRNMSPTKNKSMDAEVDELEKHMELDRPIKTALDVDNNCTLEINQNSALDHQRDNTSMDMIIDKSSQQEKNRDISMAEPKQAMEYESMNKTKITVDIGSTQNVKDHDRTENAVFKTSQESENDKTSEEKQTKKGRRKSRESDSQKPYRCVISETISSVTSCELTQEETNGHVSAAPVVPETLSPNRVCGKLNCSIKVNHLHPKVSPNPSPQKGKKLDIPHDEDNINDHCDKNCASDGTSETNAIPEGIKDKKDDDSKGMQNNKVYKSERVDTESFNIQSEKADVLTEQLSQNSGSSGSFGSNILTEQTKSPMSLYTSDSSESSASEFTESESESSVDSGNEDPSFEKFSLTAETLKYDNENDKDTRRKQTENKKQPKLPDTLLGTKEVPTESSSSHTVQSDNITEGAGENPDNDNNDIVSKKHEKDAEVDKNNGDKAKQGTESHNKQEEILEEKIREKVKFTDEIVKQVVSPEITDNQSHCIQMSNTQDINVTSDTSKVHNILTQSPDKSFLLQSLLSGVENEMKAKHSEGSKHTEAESNTSENNHPERESHNMLGSDSCSSRKLSEFELFGSPLSLTSGSSSGSESDGDTESTSESSSCGCSSCSCGGSSSSSSFSDSSIDDSSESDTEDEIKKVDNKNQSTDNRERQTEGIFHAGQEDMQICKLNNDSKKKQAVEADMNSKEKTSLNVENKDQSASRNYFDEKEGKQLSEVDVDGKAKQTDNNVDINSEEKQPNEVHMVKKEKKIDDTINIDNEEKQTSEVDGYRDGKKTDINVHNDSGEKQIESNDFVNIKDKENSTENVDSKKEKIGDSVGADIEEKQTDIDAHISKSKQNDDNVNFELKENHIISTINSKKSTVSDNNKVANNLAKCDKIDKRNRKSSDSVIKVKSPDVYNTDMEVGTPEKESANGFKLTAKEISPCVLKICRKSKTRGKQDRFEKIIPKKCKRAEDVEENVKRIKTQAEKEPEINNSKKRNNSNKPGHQLQNKNSSKKDNIRQPIARPGHTCDLMNLKSKDQNTNLKDKKSSMDETQLNIIRHSCKNKLFETTDAKIASLSGGDVTSHSTKPKATINTAFETHIPPAKIKEFLGKAKLSHGKVAQLNSSNKEKSTGKSVSCHTRQNTSLSEKPVPKSNIATYLNKKKPRLSNRAPVVNSMNKNLRSMNKNLGNKKADTVCINEDIDTASKVVGKSNPEKQSSKEKLQVGKENLSQSDHKQGNLSVEKIPIVPVTDKNKEPEVTGNKKEPEIDLKDSQKNAKSDLLELKILSPERALREVTSFHLESYKIPKRKAQHVQLNKEKESKVNHRKRVLDSRMDKKRQECKQVTSKVVNKSQNKKQVQPSTGKDRHSQNKTVLNDSKSSRSSESLKCNLMEKTSDLKSRRTSVRQDRQRTVKSKEVISSSESESESDTTNSSDSELSNDSDRIVEAIFGKSSSSSESGGPMKHTDICKTHNGESTDRSANELDTANSTIDKTVSRKRPRKISSDTDHENSDVKVTKSNIEKISSDTDHENSDVKVTKSNIETSESHLQNKIPGQELVSPRTNIVHQAGKLVTEMIENKLEKEKTKVIKSPDSRDKNLSKKTKNSEINKSEKNVKRASLDKKQASRSPEGLHTNKSSVAGSKCSSKEPDISLFSNEMESLTGITNEVETRLEKNCSPSNAGSKNENLVKQVSTDKVLPKETEIQKKGNNPHSILSLDFHSEETILDFIDCNEEMSFGDESDSSAESDSSSSSSQTNSSSEEGEISDDSEAEPIPFKRSPTKPFKLFQENTASAEKTKLKNRLNFSSIGGKKFSPIKFPISSGLENTAVDLCDVRTPPYSVRLDKRKYRSDSDSDSEVNMSICSSTSKRNSSACRRIISSNEQNIRHEALSSRRNKHFESPKLFKPRSRSRSPRIRRERSLERYRNRDRDKGRSDSDQSRRRRKGASRDSSRDSNSDKERRQRHRFSSKSFKSRCRRGRQNSNSSHYDSNSDSRMNLPKSNDKSDRLKDSVSEKKQMEKCGRETRYKTRSSDKDLQERRKKVRTEQKQNSEKRERETWCRMKDSKLDSRKKPEKRKGKDIAHGKVQAKDSEVIKVHGKSHKKGQNSSSDNEELRSRRKGQKRKHFKSSTDYETDSEHSGAEKQSTPVVKKKRKDL